MLFKDHLSCQLDSKSNRIRIKNALVIEPEALKNHFLPRHPQPAIEVRLILSPNLGPLPIHF